MQQLLYAVMLVQPEGLCCRGCSGQSVPLAQKGALFLLGNVPPRSASQWGAALWSSTSSVWLEMLFMIDQNLKSSTSSRWWEQGDTMADSDGAAWAPLSVSSTRLCCWLFSKSIKVTTEISLVSLGNSPIEGFHSRGPHTMQGWSIISVLLGFFSPNSAVHFNVQAGTVNYLHHV